MCSSDLICGGAFPGLDKIITQRTEKTGIGFNADVKSRKAAKAQNDLLRQLEPDDLVRYGLIPEFVGRLPVAAVLDELDDAALMSILCEPKNALVKQYGKLFQMEGAQLEFRDDALKAIASRARERKTGARGLRTIMESILVDVMYDLPSMTNVSKVVVDEAVVRGEVKPFIVYENAEVKRESKKPAA